MTFSVPLIFCSQLFRTTRICMDTLPKIGIQKHGMAGDADLPHRKQRSLPRFLPRREPLCPEHGGCFLSARRVHRQPPHRLCRPAEERQRGDGRQERDGLPAETEQVAAVIQRIAVYRPDALDLTGDGRPRDRPPAEENLQKCRCPRREAACQREHEHNGRTSHPEPPSLDELCTEKGGNGREQPAEGEGQKKEHGTHPDMGRELPRRTAQHRKQDAAKQFGKIPRPDGQRQDGKEQALRSARGRSEEQARNAHTETDALEGEIQKKPVKKGIFRKGIFDVDDHPPSPAEIGLTAARPILCASRVS